MRRERQEDLPADPRDPDVVRAKATVTAAVTAGPLDGTGDGTAGRPPSPDRSASAVEQKQHIFHELHADGRNTQCGVCDGQYGSA